MGDFKTVKSQNYQGVEDVRAASRRLYEVQVLENAKKMRFVLEGLFWDDTPDTANKLARSVWGAYFDPMMPEGGIDNCVNVRGEKTRPGEPYQASACIGLGAASINISVNRVEHGTLQSYAPQILKQILKSRSLSTAGDKDALVARLVQYMAARPQLDARPRSRSRG